MRVVVGADHAGFPLKQDLVAHLEGCDHVVIDVGTDSTDPVDYPDFAAAVARAVVAGEGERGIVVCGSGAGASIAANKISTGNSKRAMRQRPFPASASPLATASMKAESIGAPAPCAKATVIGALAGPSKRN